jgi:hypothetical protein
MIGAAYRKGSELQGEEKLRVASSELRARAGASGRRSRLAACAFAAAHSQLATRNSLLLLLFLAACLPEAQKRERYDREMTVVVTETTVHQRPDALSRRLGTLSFGQVVKTASEAAVGSQAGWEELQLEDGQIGFVRASALGSVELLGKLRELQESLEGVEPQAQGRTSAATFLRLEPHREAQGVEKLSAGVAVEVFERRASMHEVPAKDPQGKPTSRKDIWYKVRLADGRVGWVYTGNLRFVPPADLDEYTRFRRPVAWLRLRTVEGGPLGQMGEWLVAYSTPGVDYGADFNRVEVYTWDGKSYGTAFARSGLKGILPIRVERGEKSIHYEIGEVDPKQPGKLVVRRFHFPYPYREVERKVVEADVGLH